MTVTSSPPSADRLLAALAARQYGVFALWQALAAGVSRQAVQRRFALGRLHRVHAGVYALGHPALTREGRWMAAVLACGPAAVLSHRDAAALHGFHASAATRFDVTVPGRSHRRHPGIAVHRPRVLPEDEITARAGIPVTTPERTLLDLAEVLAGRPLERACDQAEAARAVDWARVDELLTRHPGRLGARRLRRLLRDHPVGEDRARSELERRVASLCGRHRLPRPEVNAAVEGLEVDLAWPDARVIVEVDGFAWHRTRRAFEDDRARDTRLAAAGWRVLRVTHRRLEEDARTFAAELGAVLTGTGDRPSRNER